MVRRGKEINMIVQTEYGKVKGAPNYGAVLFKGIPYAKAPTRERRFRRPEKHPKWDGVFDACRWGNKCIQRQQEKGSFYQIEFYNNDEFSTSISEDCLNLNIWLPKNIEEIIANGTKLPVAIYVHGGAFLGGAGSNLPFVATRLVEEEVIVVTINYRLGVFGFLSHPILSEISGEESFGNYGLWDQIAAIKWVKDNIANFGGDSDNITLFGQSAGAMSLQILSLSDEARGLYHKMIMQSGGGYHNPLGAYQTLEAGTEYGEWFIEEICKKKGYDRSDEEAIKKYLVEADASELQELSGLVTMRSFKAGRGFAFVPVIDGAILKEDGDTLIEKGQFAKTPYILGANRNDITMESATDFSADKNPMEKANIELAKKANENGADAYVYYFERQLPGDNSGAFHSAELWYVFGSLDYCWRKEQFTTSDYELSWKMIKYWTHFMKTGNPNNEDCPSWDKCTRDNGFIMELK